MSFSKVRLFFSRFTAVVGMLLLAGMLMGLVIEGMDSTDNTLREVKVDSDGRLEPSWMAIDDDAAANCVAITASSAQFTLPTATDFFRVCAWGNTAYVLCGASPTATTTVTTGFSFLVGDGQCHDLRIESAKCAVISTATTGSLCFMRFDVQ